MRVRIVEVLYEGYNDLLKKVVPNLLECRVLLDHEGKEMLIQVVAQTTERGGGKYSSGNMVRTQAQQRAAELSTVVGAGKVRQYTRKLVMREVMEEVEIGPE